MYIYIYIYIYFTSLPRSLGPTKGRGGREGGGEGRAQPVQDRVPLKASWIGKRHDSGGCPGTIMRPGSPRLGVVVVKRDMQHSDFR